MPRTVDHIVAMSDLANKRRNAGKPIWADRITVRLEGEEFEPNRDAWAHAIESSHWFKSAEEYGELWQIWDEMKDAETLDHFNTCLDALYDEADYDRVWITVDHD